MAEVLLRAVLNKLTGFVVEKAIEKALSLYGIRGEVEKLSHELIYIQAFLKDADRKHIVNEVQMQWVKDVMDVAYQIEDVVDVFLMECPEKLPGIMGRFGWLAKRTTKIPFLRKFQQEIKKIQDRIHEIEQYRKRYEINTLGEDEVPQPETKLDPVDDANVVGFDTHRDKITEYLLDEGKRNLAVVSIVGIGGLGKTTLAKKICKSDDVIRTFGEPVWITLSQKNDLLVILRKIAKKFNIGSTDHNDQNELADRIRKSLEEKRYLIVFDDVWEEKFWDEMKKVILDNEKGSRVLITTRIENVAKAADTTYPPYKLPFLDEKESLKFLFQKAVPRNQQCPDPNSDLYNLAKKFATKCEGLPLALKVLGGLLSKRQYNFHEWKKLKTMSWKIDGSECNDIIATSYEYLPLAKKLCFLYFAAFPEDEEIDPQSLLRIWIAERLIPNESTRTLEETAECFLEDLIQRSMVQVSKRHPDGSIMFCRVHDVLRDLAIEKAKEMNFLMVCSKSGDWESSSKARRVAIDYSSDKQIGNHASPNVRSLILFGTSYIGKIELDCSKYRVLRILDHMGEATVKMQSFRGSPHLRYLKLMTESINNREREFGEWVRSMKYLETLDIFGFHDDISEWIWQVKTLRHVLLWDDRTQGPPASADLRNLQTLKCVRWNESWETSGLPNIAEVRELNIAGVNPRFFVTDKHKPSNKEFPVRVLASLLDKLKYLSDLTLDGDVVDSGNINWAGFKYLKNLKSLQIYGRSEDTLVLDNDTFPSHLIELVLYGFGFGADPMPVLEKLECLKYLYISGRKGENLVRRIRCSAGGFKLLELLTLDKFKAEEWEIEMGAMPMLNYLRVDECDPLIVPPELIHLHTLQDLSLRTHIQTNKDVANNIRQQRSHLRLYINYELIN